MLVHVTVPSVLVLSLLPAVLAQTSSPTTSGASSTRTSRSSKSATSTSEVMAAMATYTASVPSYVASIASSYSLTSSASLAMPVSTAPAATATSFIDNNWSLKYNKLVFGNNDVSFVQDQSGQTSDGSVLQVDYPAGSYNGGSGGAQFYAQPLVHTSNSQGSTSALLSYSVWFPSNFSFVQGGKLPGLRGGPDTSGCSGGSQTDGTSCFSARLMWRTSGAGEVYGYVPVTSGLCSQSGVTCNSDYGTSFGRGDFSFQRGAWNQVAVYVALNNPASLSNGVIQLWYNGVQAFKFDNLQIRTADSLNGVGGIFFSTFFGGNDASWASPADQSTLFKDMVLFAGQSTVSTSDAPRLTGPGLLLVVMATLLASSAALVSL